MQKNVLILILNNEGGSKIFLDQYIERALKDCNIWVLKSEQTINNPQDTKSKLFVFNYRTPEGVRYVLNAEIQNLNELLKVLNINEIFVNHLMHFNFSLMGSWLINCKVPFKIFLHDYYCICPNVHLQHCNHSYVKFQPPNFAGIFC